MPVEMDTTVSNKELYQEYKRIREKLEALETDHQMEVKRTTSLIDNLYLNLECVVNNLEDCREQWQSDLFQLEERLKNGS